MRALLILLTLTLTACTPPDSGMAGCWERHADGRTSYRADWAPMANGLCPTWSEMMATRDMGQKFDAAGCGTACKVGLLLIMGLR